MMLAYDGEDEKLQKSLAEIVDTYRPAGENGSEYKGTAYAKQMELVEQKELSCSATV